MLFAEFRLEVKETGEIIFDAVLKKIKNDISNAEKLFHKAIAILEGNCPTKSCEWCDGR